jgi:hypothetical protein
LRDALLELPILKFADIHLVKNSLAIKHGLKKVWLLHKKLKEDMSRWKKEIPHRVAK